MFGELIFAYGLFADITDEDYPKGIVWFTPCIAEDVWFEPPITPLPVRKTPCL